MQIFEVVLVILGCIIIAAIVTRFVPKVALPLVQIAVGLVAALVLPELTTVHMESELFLVLFIAPLLFNESRKANKRELWRNKWSVISLAIGLVVATVLIVGFALNLIMPSIPLAAAFALAGALAPTDAAAVMAMGSSVKLTKQQETRLSGESLINDASGVVSFQFAIAAVVTGSFSMLNAVETFGILFLGGIVFGAVIGLIARYGVSWMRERGLADTRLHVVYEVFTPFAVFLLGEFLGVSGILAVVACGFAMADPPLRLASTAEAQNIVLSNSVWRVIVFLINGVIFVLLGMQLPLAFSPTVLGQLSTFELFGLVALVFFLVLFIRFVWLFVMEMLPTKCAANNSLRERIRSALIMTLAGPKGSVTLSIIFTIPFVLADGQPFPERDLLIFITAAVILGTLVAANIALPLLGHADASQPDNENDLRVATIHVLEGTIAELVDALHHPQGHPELVPALRTTIAGYRTRLARERFQEEHLGNVLLDLELEVYEKQQEHTDEVMDSGRYDFTTSQLAFFFHSVRWIRASMGYYGKGMRAGTHVKHLRDKLALALQRFKTWLAPNPIDSEDRAYIYYEACQFALELERVAIDYLESVIRSDTGARAKGASLLCDEHKTADDFVWGRLCFIDADNEAFKACDACDKRKFLREEASNFSEQFAMASRHANLMDAWALTIELEQIQRLYLENEINEEMAKALRDHVYIMQMAME